MLKLTAVALASGILGCTPVMQPTRTPKEPDYYTTLNHSPRPMQPRAEDSVAIFSTRTPEAKYIEVAMLADDGDNEAAALVELKHSAAHVGCDGLILHTAQVVSVRYGEAADMRASGVCIMFVDDDGAWRAPPADEEQCRARRVRLAEARTSQEKLAIAHSMPVECHRAR